MRYLHTMVRIGNLETALDFFCEKLGMVEVRRYDNDKGKFTLVFLAADKDAKEMQQTDSSIESAATRLSPILELTYNWGESEYDAGRNFGHLAYEVDNIYAFCQGLMDKGVTINRPPRDGRMAFIKSPDGISLELLQAGDNLEIKEPWASMENSGNW